MREQFGRDALSHAALVDVLRPRLLSRIDIDLDVLRESLDRHPRLVHVISHGGSLSWLPIYVALMSKLGEVAPRRLHVGSFHKGLWKFARPLVRFIAGTERHLTYAELERVLADVASDFWAFPESDNSMYGDLHAIKPFRFLRFIEVAVNAKMPMLLVAHVGSEVWYQTLHPERRLQALAELLPSRVYRAMSLDKRRFLDRIGVEPFHFPLPMKRVHLRIATELHLPERFEVGYADDPEARKEQLLSEAEVIRTKLQGLVDRLRVLH